MIRDFSSKSDSTKNQSLINDMCALLTESNLTCKLVKEIETIFAQISAILIVEKSFVKVLTKKFRSNLPTDI